MFLVLQSWGFVWLNYWLNQTIRVEFLIIKKNLLEPNTQTILDRVCPLKESFEFKFLGQALQYELIVPLRWNLSSTSVKVFNIYQSVGKYC